MASHPVAALWLAALLLGSCFGAPTIRTKVNNLDQPLNSDVLARLQDRVSISCMDDSTSRAGSISVNGVLKGQDGRLTIQSMSVEDQGRYACCVDGACPEIAIITVPPNNNTEVVVAVGERAALRCPLEFMKEFGQFYKAQWRVGGRTIATTNPEQSLEPWAQVDVNTLTLTVGPFDSTPPEMFACVLLSFNRSNPIDFGIAARGTVNITLASTQNMSATISPPVIASGSSEQFNITCQAEMGQVLYQPSYQFFFNGSPIGAPTNSSYIMVDATSSGNFKCNATQYSDQGTPVPSPQSAAVQAIVLDAPRLDRPDQDNDCYQEVTVTLQQPMPEEMYYAFSKTTESCTGVGQMYSLNITTGESRLEFTVNVGQSGLDTRREVYLVSWYTMNGVMGPCSNELMKPTEEACPPSPPLPVTAIAVGVAAFVLVLILVAILLAATVAIAAYKKRITCKTTRTVSLRNPQKGTESRACCC